MPFFRIRFHEEIYVDLCVEAPSREAASLWAEDRDGKFADATSEHLSEQTVVERYVSDLAPWKKDDGNPGVVYELDAEGEQIGRRENVTADDVS